MDLHQETMAAVEIRLDTPWGPPAMPELRPRTRNRTDLSDGLSTIPRRWINLTRSPPNTTNRPRLTKEASTSMEDLSLTITGAVPGSVVRPKSMCIPDMRYYEEQPKSFNFVSNNNNGGGASRDNYRLGSRSCFQLNTVGTRLVSNKGDPELMGTRRMRVRRNPVQRAASRLYRAGSDAPVVGNRRDCVGPEFVVRASLQTKQIVMPDCKGNVRKVVTVIMLNGQKLDITCNPNSTTAGQLFEIIIQKEHIEENFMLGLSALIAGDFVFLPSDTRISKALPAGSSHNVPLTLFMRVRFFLPSLRGIRGAQARHLLYLQLRRSILEHQLPCSFAQLTELNGLALQAEFGDFNEREHGTRDYFLLEHYVPETMSCAVDDQNALRQDLIRSHITKRGLSAEKSQQDFIILAQSLPHYGGHFYTATWMLKDNNHKDVWLYISAQGINLYERNKLTSNCGPQLYEMFEWRSIQTLCYSKHYLCVLPHSSTLHASKLKKYKLKMDHKKSYFTFRLASLHHQFFLRLRTEYTSLQTLSHQFGIPLKDMKNETNSLCKLEALTNPNYSLDQNNAGVQAETEFKIDFRASSKCSSHNKTSDQTNSKSNNNNNKCRRAKSIHDFGQINEDYQNKENEQPSSGLVLDSSCLAGLGSISTADKRSGVKMGTRMFSNIGARVSRSMEAVNTQNNEYLEQMSLQSVSLHCSSNSISKCSINDCLPPNEAFILESPIKCSATQFLPDFQESVNETLLERLNNISFAEERLLCKVSVERDSRGSLGVQITEGSDGNVYVQSVILGSPAHLTGNILSGDQVVAVDGHNLLGMKYKDALNLLTNTGRRVEFVVSRMVPSIGNNIHSQSTLRVGELDGLKSKVNLTEINESHLHSVRLENTLNKLKRFSYPEMELNRDGLIEKHVTESCLDISNYNKYGPNSLNSHHTSSSEVPYHKHIRYEIETDKTASLTQQLSSFMFSNSPLLLNRNLSKSCTQICSLKNEAKIVDVIPKCKLDLVNCRSLDRRIGHSGAHNFNHNHDDDEDDDDDKEHHNKRTIPPIALPRSLGLSRKWRGPVRYPVTPVKKSGNLSDCDSYNNYLSNSDDEQVFI